MKWIVGIRAAGNLNWSKLNRNESLVQTYLYQMGNGLTVERKKYMRDIYSKYWITAREKIYGFMEYDKNLCNYICECIPKGKKLIGVAVGTGYPFADFFQKAGYIVHGIDISPELIDKCRQVNPLIDCKVGDAEELDYSDNQFDCTYCFHSTWYFPNLNRAIDEMLRVTRADGYVIFDVQNANNKEIYKAYRERLVPERGVKKIIRYSKNICKIILRRGTPDWHNFCYEVPTYPESIYDYFRQKNISNFCVLVKKGDESLEAEGNTGSFKEFGRLVFVLEK